MNRFLLPIAALALVFTACGDDATIVPTGTDTGTGTTDIGLDIPIEDDGGECTPDCAGRECGDDGCGASCGDCAANSDCVAGVCVEGTTTELSCEAIIECINGSGGTQADMNNCIGQGTAEGQSLINDILTCIQTNCADATTDDEFAECQQAECQPEINACFGIGEGSDTCEEVVDCLLGCTTQECGTACVGEGSAEAQTEAVDGFNCAAESCAESASQEEFFACFEDSCPDEYNACYDIEVVPDPTCDDAVQNGDEEGVDCGGSCPDACEAEECVADDCDSGVCGDDGTCADATCDDAVQNGDEEGVDCGGSCDIECEVAECVAEECDSGVCGDDGTCADATCDDAVQNGDEEGVDCGGLCDTECPS